MGSIIAREGYRILAILLVLTILFYILGLRFIATAFFLFFLFTLYFFRNPRRIHNCGEGEIASPADGKVTEIIEVNGNEYIEGKYNRVSIFMSPLDVHVNRAPEKGRVERIDYRRGKFSLAFKRDIEQENERNYILIKRDGERILIVQIAGFLARRITSYVKEGDFVEKGQPVGMISFGSRVDVYLPAEYGIMVREGDKIKAGLTTLAKKEVKGS
ncbi:MAG: phosphatidylserine decarboxylase family protein [Syntrophorhabdaceae bacterium]|nr:phosphatidylserine decarboxylase family protein [Syntrophorhabdaceae bacterium]